MALTQRTVGRYQALLDALFWQGRWLGPRRGFEQLPLLSTADYRRLLYEDDISNGFLEYIEEHYQWRPGEFLPLLFDGRIPAHFRHEPGYGDPAPNERDIAGGRRLILMFIEATLRYCIELPSYVRDLHSLVEDLFVSLQVDGFVYTKGKIVPADSVEATTALSEVPAEVQELSWAGVNSAWRKASNRVATDPDGAVTSARALLETVCIHILEKKGIPRPTDGDLQKLYKETAKVLQLSPGEQNEQKFKMLLSGCVTVTNGLAGLRNELSDSHGKGLDDQPSQARHARLAVNAAGTVALFLIESYAAESEGAGA